jgi:hypothetical protein
LPFAESISTPSLKLPKMALSKEEVTALPMRLREAPPVMRTLVLLPST